MKPIEVRLIGRFRFHSKVEGDHQSLLYRATHTQTNERVILKGEEIKIAKPKRQSLTLLQEGKIYQSMQGGIGIPYMHWCGQEEDYNFIVLEQLEATLSNLLSRCGSKFSLKTALMVGIELTTILQYYHFKHFIYNNIAPKHIMVGRGDNYDKLYLIDYSKSNRFRDSNTQEHVMEPVEKNWDLRFSNMEFSSLNYQKGNSPTRRDDLESLLYLIAYFLNGQLPWSNEVKNTKKVNFKNSSCSQKLFRGYPQLQTLYQYTLSLKFDEKPQYSYYMSMFNQMLQKADQINDKIYDWIFLEDDEPVPELNYKFDIYEEEDQMWHKINDQILNTKAQSTQSSKNIASVPSTRAHKQKNDKQCIIY